MTDTPHTPLPWKGTDSRTGIFSAGEPLGKNKIIGICAVDAVSRPLSENIANADFILTACNSHYDLLEALEKIANLDGRYRPAYVKEIAISAIAKARRAP